MDSIAKDIAEYIADQGVGTMAEGDGTGWRIFYSHEPATPDNTITLFDFGGDGSFLDIKLDDNGFQVRVRSQSYNDAYVKIRDIQDILGAISQQQIGSSYYVGVWTAVSVVPLGRDDKDRTILVASYRTNRQPVVDDDTT